MRARFAAVLTVVSLSVAACEKLPTSPVTAERPAAFGAKSPIGASSAVAQTGPSNQCYGAIAAGISSTWPWAHEGHSAFPPSPGAIALFVTLFGPQIGVSSVRELQLLFCSS
jgi:hypothetical protein